MKDSYSRMESVNEILLQKLILVRAGKVEDAEKALDELMTTLQQYCEK